MGLSSNIGVGACRNGSAERERDASSVHFFFLVARFYHGASVVRRLRLVADSAQIPYDLAAHLPTPDWSKREKDVGGIKC